MRDFTHETAEIAEGIPLKKGNDVYIGKGVQIIGKGPIEIGDKTAIAWESILISDNHDWKNNIDVTIEAPIKIGKHCWIGARCIILGNSEIGDNCVVGAGSVVRGKFPSNCMILGNPAKIVKTGIGEKDV